jgi:hypothetical protein
VTPGPGRAWGRRARPAADSIVKLSGDVSLFCWNSRKAPIVRRERGASAGLVVSSPKELRAYAEECIGWARSTRADNERDIFLQMARTWIEAATRLEHTLGIVDAHRENAKPALK